MAEISSLTQPEQCPTNTHRAMHCVWCICNTRSECECVAPSHRAQVFILSIVVRTLASVKPNVHARIRMSAAFDFQTVSVNTCKNTHQIGLLVS